MIRVRTLIRRFAVFAVGILGILLLLLLITEEGLQETTLILIFLNLQFRIIGAVTAVRFGRVCDRRRIRVRMVRGSHNGRIVNRGMDEVPRAIAVGTTENRKSRK